MLTNTATTAPKRHKYLTASKVRHILQQQEASGTSLYQYCQDHGLPYKTIVGRQNKQSKVRVDGDTQAAFVPIEVKPGVTPVEKTDAVSDACSSAMEIRLRHQRTICVRGDFDVAMLQRLVVTLEALPC
jgi:hypothetical protein